MDKYKKLLEKKSEEIVEQLAKEMEQKMEEEIAREFTKALKESFDTSIDGSYASTKPSNTSILTEEKLKELMDNYNIQNSLNKIYNLPYPSGQSINTTIDSAANAATNTTGNVIITTTGNGTIPGTYTTPIPHTGIAPINSWPSTWANSHWPKMKNPIEIKVEKLEKQVDLLLKFMVMKGLIESEEEFSDFLDSVNVMEKLCDSDEENK